MAGTQLPEEKLTEAVEAVKAHNGDVSAAARSLDLPRSTLVHRVRTAAEKGLGGYAPEPAPPGYTIKGKSTLYREGEPILEWVKTAKEESDRQAEWIAALEDVLQRFKGFAVLPPRPKETDADLAVVYPRPDLHLGLYAWGEETGRDWDVDIARRQLGRAAEYLVASAPPAETAVVLGLGDLLHADDSRNQTPRSGNALDVDTRHARVMRLAAWLEIAKVQLALQKHARVVYKALPGNHDPHSAVALSLAVSMFFHDESRVEVDQSPKARWYWEWGVNLIGCAHGHQTKQTDLPLLMAADMPEAWGRASCKRFYTGHLHHKRALEHGGVLAEQFQSPAGKDAFHAAGPWVSGRSMVAITFHRTRGEIGRVEYSLDLEDA